MESNNGTWGKPHHNMIQVIDKSLGKINVTFTWRWRELPRENYRDAREYFEQLQIGIRHTPVYEIDGRSVHGFATAFTQRGINAVVTDAYQSYDQNGKPTGYIDYTLKRVEEFPGVYTTNWGYARPVPDGMANTIRELLSTLFAEYANCTDLIETMRRTQRRVQIARFEDEKRQLIDRIAAVDAMREEFERTIKCTLDPREKR